MPLAVLQTPLLFGAQGPFTSGEGRTGDNGAFFLFFLLFFQFGPPALAERWLGRLPGVFSSLNHFAEEG